jgi:transposase
MARPSKYSPETVKKIEEALEAGATYKLAAAYAGIHFDTFNDWRQRFPEFSDLVKSAEAKAAVGWLEQIEQAARDGHWQAAAWKLERRYPDEWGRKDRLELDVRREAERLAREHGLDAGQLIHLADRIARSG